MARLAVTVSMQPGNNYRGGASTIQSALSATTQTQADGNTPPQDVVFTEMLTIWRKLHVETDSMVRPTLAQNTYPMAWTNPTDGGAPDRVQVQVDDPEYPFVGFPTPTGQFDSGWIELTGKNGVVIGRIFEYRSSGGWDEVIAIVSAQNGLGGQQGLAGLGGMTDGNSLLSDDDLGEEATFAARIWGCNDGFAAGSVLLPPDLDALELRYEPAYIKPVPDTQSSAVGGLVTFLQHFVESDDNGKALWDQALAARNLCPPGPNCISEPDYWTVMVVSAFQAENHEDADPNTEEETNGVSTHNAGSTTSLIGSNYTGICAVFKAVTLGESDIPEEYTVAHEIGHTLGLPHNPVDNNDPPMGLMDPKGDGQHMPFIAENLERLRGYDGP